MSLIYLLSILEYWCKSKQSRSAPPPLLRANATERTASSAYSPTVTSNHYTIINRLAAKNSHNSWFPYGKTIVTKSARAIARAQKITQFSLDPHWNWILCACGSAIRPISTTHKKCHVHAEQKRTRSDLAGAIQCAFECIFLGRYEWRRRHNDKTCDKALLMLILTWCLLVPEAVASTHTRHAAPSARDAEMWSRTKR